MPFPDTAALIVCSDGVWDALTFITAARWSCPRAIRPSQPKLVAKAVRARGLRDDTTAVVLVGGVSMQSLTSSEPSSDASNEFAASEIQNAASSTPRGRDSPPSSRFHVRSGIKSLLRAPVKLRDHIGSENSVKGGKLFEALAKSLSSSGGMDMLNNNNSNSNDSKHSEHSFSSGHSSESNATRSTVSSERSSGWYLAQSRPIRQSTAARAASHCSPSFTSLRGCASPQVAVVSSSPEWRGEGMGRREARRTRRPLSVGEARPAARRSARGAAASGCAETPPRAGAPVSCIRVLLCRLWLYFLCMCLCVRERRVVSFVWKVKLLAALLSGPGPSVSCVVSGVA